MRLVYIDEAGISKGEPHVVVAGCIVHGDHVLNGLENQLERLVHRHIPAEHHEGFVFSAKHIFNGDNKVFKRDDPEWPIERRLAIADDLAAIVKKFKVPIALGWLDRAEFPQTFDISRENWSEDERSIAMHVTAFMQCSKTIEHWMRQRTTNENCLLVVEDNDRARKHIRDVHRYHQDRKIMSLLGAKERLHFPLRKIKEDPLFQPKKQNSPLVLADLCAYVWKKTLAEDHRYDRFFEPIRKQIILIEDF